MKISKLSKEDLAQLAIAVRASSKSKGQYTQLVESIDTRLQNIESMLGAEGDTIGFSVVMIAGQCVKPEMGDVWQEEFRQWYKPKEWLGSHRAAGVFLGMKCAGLTPASNENAT